jgi:hypothetical protein
MPVYSNERLFVESFSDLPGSTFLADSGHSHSVITSPASVPEGEGGGIRTGKNSGGAKPAHTSYPGPNCRRNKSEKAPRVTGIGRRMTVPTYGIAAMQQVAHATAQLITTAATPNSRRNKT